MKPEKRQKNKRTVALALGSGGARGLAHIGVINWLQEHNYEIRSISGSSMGALIGGIFAAGKLDDYTHWVTALRKRDVIRLLDFAFSRSGLFSGERIIQTLKDLVGDTNIEDLPILFTAVATDLDTEKEVWIKEGPLFDAIRASIATPTVFTPVRYKGHTLVDGGLLNPIPIGPMVTDFDDISIAVNLSGKREEGLGKEAKEEKPQGGYYQNVIGDFIDMLQARFSDQKEDKDNVLNVLTRSLECVQNSMARFKLAAYSPDYIIDIPANACSMLEFYRAEEMIKLGYERAAKTLAE
ncbi:MAG TPA: serine protease [Acidiferrobacteraceae bacterium]|nr:serine protease [Acidiferrobacteraceae bacterium]